MISSTDETTTFSSTITSSASATMFSAKRPEQLGVAEFEMVTRLIGEQVQSGE